MLVQTPGLSGGTPTNTKGLCGRRRRHKQTGAEGGRDASRGGVHNTHEKRKKRKEGLPLSCRHDSDFGNRLVVQSRAGKRSEAGRRTGIRGTRLVPGCLLPINFVLVRFAFFLVQ